MFKFILGVFVGVMIMAFVKVGEVMNNKKPELFTDIMNDTSRGCIYFVRGIGLIVLCPLRMINSCFMALVLACKSEPIEFRNEKRK